MKKHPKAIACDADHGGRTGFTGAAVLRVLGWGACALLVAALAAIAAGCGGGGGGNDNASGSKGPKLPT